MRVAITGAGGFIGGALSFRPGSRTRALRLRPDHAGVGGRNRLFSIAFGIIRKIFFQGSGRAAVSATGSLRQRKWSARAIRLL